MEINKHLPAFVVITGQVHFDKNLSDKDVRIYGYISALANSKGYCYATNKYLAETFDVSEKTIQRAVSSLTSKGYLNPVIMRDSEGMVVERRLYLTFPAPNENAYEPHNDGMDKFVHRGMDKNVQYNNINNNNNYGAVNTDTSEHSKKTSSKKNDNEDKQLEKKSEKKNTVVKIDTESTYYKIMQHFNLKDNTKFKSNAKEYMKNIDILLQTYSEDEVKNVIDYVYECNYNEKYWRPSTIFRVSNFERSYEFAEKWLKKKAHDNNSQASQQQQLFYFVNVNTKQVVASPVKPNLPDNLVFSTREQAEATLT